MWLAAAVLLARLQCGVVSMSVDAAADRALELHTAGATAHGVALLRSSVARAPRHFETRFRLGSLLHVSGDLDGAVASYAAAIALDAGVAVAHVNMGEAQRIRGDLVLPKRLFVFFCLILMSYIFRPRAQNRLALLAGC